MAASLGFEGQPIELSREYHWSANDAAVLVVYATRAFQSSQMPHGDTSAGSISTAEEAIAAARTWLEDRDLLPADCTVAPEACPNDRDLPPGSLPAYPGWIVRFQRPLNGIPVGGFWTSGVILELEDDGRVHRMTYVHRKVEGIETVPLRPVADAWAELQAIAAPAFVDTSFPLGGETSPDYTPAPRTGVVTSVMLAYREHEVNVQQPTFEPYYAFHGDLDATDPYDRPITFIAYVPARSSGVLQTPTPAIQPTTASVEVSDALRRDAETMAEELGIPVDEAIRRLKLQDPIGTMGAELERQEADTFAGLWIQHEPEYRIVVAFTRNGEETIQPYIENTSLADLVEVRNAEATYEELKAAQQEAHRLLDESGLSLASGIDIKENRVDLYVTDRSLFDTTLREANVRLPDYVEVITIYEPLGDDIPFAVTPNPTIHFPQLRTRSATFMTALLVGKLIVKDGCLRVSVSERDRGHLIIWQPDYFLNSNEGVVEILDRNGEAVARVGEEIRIGGGEVALTANLKRQLREPLPEQCEGPYWLMGQLVSE
ncbi:MAG: hypothetical protein U9Q78_04935 [Chloroflexota bacterium]|nr:hypothetical protein [Chloroflexota bacterium]